ncbi:MAG: carboxypeptidase regulatory-like domain-containing protein [Planctomycetales bacterium]|nr:carboxypeptidase regulatory-like domain-containing protein [bacterium]UNM07799.1 MAG: carboxypeptidase regulatory-like domain-containing protein [Planctomycetales bacterium]
MKRLDIYLISLFIVIVSAMSASCGGSNVGIEQPTDNNDNGTPSVEEQLEQSEIPSLAELDKLFGGEEAGQEKGASWISHPNHLTPGISFNGGIDAGDPNCYLLKGFKGDVPGANGGAQIAFAIYQIPLGALETDLLDMKVAAQVSSATETYYAAIADFTGMHWDFYGPMNSPSWYTDMTSLGYDFTSAAGHMYIALIAMPDTNLHITDITLNFKDREKPTGEDQTWWNVWGQAYEDYVTGSPHAGYQVSFENLSTGVVYTTMTAANGAWGMNLPSGHYKFGVDSNEMLLDVSGAPALIDYIYDVSGFGIKMDLAFPGEFTYVDDNAAYFGSVVPMPLITVNNF